MLKPLLTAGLILTYYLTDQSNEVEITDGTNVLANLIIPITITNGNGTVFIVTKIGANAFNDDGLTSVMIPRKVIVIGANTFRCNALTTVNIGNAITKIGDTAFAEDTSITTVSLTSINPTILLVNTFDNNNIIDLIISVGIQTTYNAADWTGFVLTTEQFGAEFDFDGMTYSITSVNPNTVTLTDCNNTTRPFIIPETVPFNADTFKVTATGDGVFFCKALTGVTIYNTIIRIVDRTF